MMLAAATPTRARAVSQALFEYISFCLHFCVRFECRCMRTHTNRMFWQLSAQHCEWSCHVQQVRARKHTSCTMYLVCMYVCMSVCECVCMYIYSWVNACRARRSAALLSLLLRCWRFVLRCLFKTEKVPLFLLATLDNAAAALLLLLLLLPLSSIR